MSLVLLDPCLVHLSFSEPRAKYYSQVVLGTWETPSSPGSILNAHSANLLREHIWAQAARPGPGLFFTAHLLCPILFLDTLSLPTDTGAQFPNSQFNEMAPKVLLSIRTRKPAFSNTCCKKHGWTWHSLDSSLSWRSLSS